MQRELTVPIEVPRRQPKANGGRIPRVSRLMALAIRCEGLIASGVLRDYTELAVLGEVSKARATQLMNLLHLAPDIQEQLLFLPPETGARDRITEHHLRAVAAIVDWEEQRELFSSLCSAFSGAGAPDQSSREQVSCG